MARLQRRILYTWNILLALYVTLSFVVQAEEFKGRHVCTQNQQISQPVPITQTYTNAVYNEELKRVVYQTARRIIFRMHLQSKVVPSCCPGWQKRSPREASCMKPVCEDECENGGQCISPRICLCSRGYTGYRCEIEIDECQGRHQCQHKCTNVPGSYQCSCQEGFTLAADQRSCELCLSCTQEFKDIQAKLKQAQDNTNQTDLLHEIRNDIDKLYEVTKKTEMIHDIQRQLYNLTEITVNDQEFNVIRTEIEDLKEMKNHIDTIQDLNTKVDTLFGLSLQNDQFQSLQTQINTLNDLKPTMDSVDVLAKKIEALENNDTHAIKIQALEEEMDTLYETKLKADKVDDLQKDIEQLREMKSKADKVDDIQKDIEELREMKKEVDKFEELKKIIEQMSKRIQELENEREVLRNNLTAAVTQYQAAVSSFHEKEVNIQPMTTIDPYEMDPKMPLDRLASLSQQISLLEEKMADCQCTPGGGGENWYG